MDVDQSKLISDERLEKKTGLDKDASVNNDVMDVDMEENVLTDADVKTLPKEENITEKVEPAGENVIKGVTNDVVKTVNEDVSDDVKVLSNKDVKQELPADKSVLSTHPEPMEISEPMETSDVKEQQSHVENEMMSKGIDLTSEKEAVDPVQLVKEGSGEPKPAPNTDSVLPTESKQLPVVETVAFSGQKPPPEREPAVSVSEDLKSESKVAPTIGSGMCEDSKPEAPDMDIVMCDEPKQAPSTDSAVADHPKLVRNAESVVSNMDSIMSEDSKLAPNMDSVMSDDSKLLSNLDSMLSSGLDESEDTFFAVKGPSAVVPFGENANSSMPIMEGKSLLEGENSNFSFVDESSQSNSMAEKPSRPKRARRSSISDIQDSKNEMEDGLHIFPAERVFEYQWPQDGGEWYLLQEQISEYLGVLSFKRKYPDLTRRTCDKLEKEFLREKGVVTETQSDLGLTAIRSEEVYDLMMKDYPDKYHEYATLLHEREKQKISDKHKEYEVAQPKLEKSKMADYMKKAAKSAAEYNRHLLRERKEERLAFFDLQTFMIQFPDGRYKKLPPEATKPSAYPVALIPGQFQDHYCSYTSDELRYFPLNTALYDPPKRMSNTLAKPAGSGESSDDSSEDKSGSSSDSSGSGSGSSDSETPASAAAAAAAASAAKGSNADSSQPVPRPPTPAEAAATPAKKSAKKGGKAAAAAKTPAKSPGRPLKGKRKLEVSAEEKESSGTSAASTPVVPPTAQPASPAPGKEKAEEEEDKDKCRICKNAVLFLKYKRVETKMIKCSECGKIAHPTCLDLTDKMVQVVTTYPWQCMECKTCVECMDPYDEDKMLFCDRCDRGYHTFCVGLRCLPSGRWECRSCKGVAETAKSRRGRPLKPT
ncbi:uncharacterized protein LOC143281206 [Babylonia areolata]|uniref:uncharacterized protein LOC143281206 n=1 Tax=Babylonia areolata TaxID=304850 RepID=UPI003FD24E72